MSYCSVDDLKDQVDEARLIQLTDDEGTGSVNLDRVLRAISDADEEINSYVGCRHTVPLDPVPSIIRKISVDIALLNLYGRREKVPDARADRYKSAVKFLEQVSRGNAALGLHDPEGNPPESDAPQMSGENPRRTFTRALLKGY